MPRTVDESRWLEFFIQFRASGSIRGAARRAGIDYSSARKVFDPTHNSTGRVYYEKWLAENPPGVIPYDKLKPEAKAALNDLALFSLRYFGIVERPWNLHAAKQMVESSEKARADLTEERVVINIAPGTGKSTFFTWRFPLWLICRDRRIRIQIGSSSQSLAEGYSERIRSMLEQPQIIRPSKADKLRWGAVDSVATLVEEFGRFKPMNATRWRRDNFTVAQEDDVVVTNKEATVSAYGRGSKFTGNRFDFIIWDDLVTEDEVSTVGAREKMVDFWRTYAENRVEPGGVMVLQGQRLNSDDLYRYAIDKMTPVFGDDDADYEEGAKLEETSMYRHIVYPAHADDHCKGAEFHRRTSPPFDPALPDTGGCLLDPINLGWAKLAPIRRDSEALYDLSYQQRDAQRVSRLVEPIWINGGKGADGVDYIGCLDHDRGMGEYPQGLSRPWVHVITCDPSGTQWWSVQDWLYHPASERRILINLVKERMEAPRFLQYNPMTGTYSGIAEEWVQMGKDAGFPVDALVFEENGFARWFAQYEWTKQWQSSRKLHIVGHQTQRNKSDPKLGVSASLPPQYEHGRVRLPAQRHDGTRTMTMRMIDELTHYPDTKTTDAVMAHWFLEFNLPLLLNKRLNADRPRGGERVPRGLFKGLPQLVGR